MNLCQFHKLNRFENLQSEKIIFLTDGFTNLDGKIVFEGYQIVDFDQSDEIDPL